MSPHLRFFFYIFCDLLLHYIPTSTFTILMVKLVFHKPAFITINQAICANLEWQTSRLFALMWQYYLWNLHLKFIFINKLNFTMLAQIQIMLVLVWVNFVHIRRQPSALCVICKFVRIDYSFFWSSCYSIDWFLPFKLAWFFIWKSVYNLFITTLIWKCLLSVGHSF